jgi:hypothetical protein
MAVPTTMPPTVEEFRKAFPQFGSATDEQVQWAIDTGMTWVDDWWFWPDMKMAVMYAAAHYLTLNDRASGGAISGGGGTGGGGSVTDPDVGLIWVKSVRFRDRSVTYDRVGTESSEASAGPSSGATDFWKATPYGQMYLSFLRRNAPHVAVI